MKCEYKYLLYNMFYQLHTIFFYIFEDNEQFLTFVFSLLSNRSQKPMAYIYSTCILTGLSKCGSYLPKCPVNLVKFHSLNHDVTTDIASFKIVVIQQYISSNSILLEKGLIANHAKIKEAQYKTDGDSCFKHRYNLGKYYRPPWSCIYLNHSQLNKSRSEKKAPLRAASLKLVTCIMQKCPDINMKSS